jgi:flagellar hook-basal body complex protein FliE
MASPITAANAYAKLARLADPGANPLKQTSGDSAGPSFGAMVKEAINSVVEAGHNSDGQAQAMAAGKANIVDVVTAVSETEVAVEAMVSIRDKVISAYEEIMRMPI